MSEVSSSHVPIPEWLNDRLISTHEVQKAAGISSSTLWRMVHASNFPAPIKLCSQIMRWRASEVNAWLDNLPRWQGK